MTSFAPKAVPVPSQFRRQNAGNSTNRQTELDKVFTIEEYKAPGTVLVSEEGKEGKKNYFLLSVEADAINRALSKKTDTPPKFVGAVIDERMAHHIPKGAVIVASRTKTIKYVKQTVGDKADQNVCIAECNWIKHVMDPEKLLKGVIYTASKRDNRLSRIQIFDELAIDSTDEPTLQQLADQLDTISKERAANVRTTAVGFQFRIVIPVMGEKGTPENTVVDNSHMFCYIRASKDAEGNEVTAARNVTGDDLFNLYEEFMAHAENNFPLAQYPGRKVEIKTYSEFPGSKSSRSLEIPPYSGSPIYKLVNTPVLLSKGESAENAVYEGGMAILGHVELTSDVADVKTKTFTTRNIVKDVHPNGYFGMTDIMVKMADGSSVKVDEEFRLYKKLAAEAKAATAGAAPGAATPAASQAAPVVRAAAASAPVAHAQPAAASTGAPVHDAFDDSETPPWDDAPVASQAVPAATPAPVPVVEAPPKRTFGRK